MLFLKSVSLDFDLIFELFLSVFLFDINVLILNLDCEFDFDLDSEFNLSVIFKLDFSLF